MVETTTQIRGTVEQFGIVGSVGIAVSAAVAFFIIHEVFHMLLGVGFMMDTLGSIALGAVAGLGVYALDWNYRAVIGAFVTLFVTHQLVMGYGGSFFFDGFGWSMPVAVIAAVVFFLAAGGLHE